MQAHFIEDGLFYICFNPPYEHRSPIDTAKISETGRWDTMSIIHNGFILRFWDY